MKNIIFIICILSQFSSLTAQNIIVHDNGGVWNDRLLANQDYVVHTKGHSTVNLTGVCRSVRFNMDDQSNVIMGNLQITEDLIVESINGDSHLTFQPSSYPNDTLYQARDIIVEHMDNPGSFISIKNVSFRDAYLGNQNHDRNSFGFDSAGFHIILRNLINPNSINGGGYLDLIVRRAVAGTLLGDSRLILIRGCHPNMKFFELRDQAKLYYRQGQ